MITNEKIVLYLNASWVPVSYISVTDAIIAMHSQENPALAINIEYLQKDNGSYDLEQVLGFTPLSWQNWAKLSVRNIDSFINTPSLRIRIPTVIMTPSYNKVPVKRTNPTKNRILDRDNYRCQYTGQKLTKSTRSIDHVIPRSKGGKDSWQNMVACHKNINSKKGNKFNKEVGLRLLRKPKEPPPILANNSIIEARHRDWKWFIKLK